MLLAVRSRASALKSLLFYKKSLTSILKNSLIKNFICFSYAALNMKQRLIKHMIFCFSIQQITKLVAVTMFPSVIVCTGPNGDRITSQPRLKSNAFGDGAKESDCVAAKRARLEEFKFMLGKHTPDFKTFMEDQKIVEYLDELFGRENLSIMKDCNIDKNNAYEVAAMHLYNLRKRIMFKTGTEQLSMDMLVEEHRRRSAMPNHKFSKVDISGFDISQVSPQFVDVLKFFHDHCGTTTLDLSETMIDVDRLNEVNFDKIKTLRLRHNRLARVLFLSKFTGILSLDLSNNELEDSTFICSLASLEELDISNNALRRIPFLPMCTNLRRIILRNNKIQTITGLMRYVNLEYLDLGQNNIEQQYFDNCIELIQLLGKKLKVSTILLDENTGLNIKADAIKRAFPMLNVLCLDKQTIDGLSGKAKDRFNVLRINLEPRSPSVTASDAGFQ